MKVYNDQQKIDKLNFQLYKKKKKKCYTKTIIFLKNLCKNVLIAPPTSFYLFVLNVEL